MQHIGAESRQMCNIVEQTVGTVDVQHTIVEQTGGRCATYWSKQWADERQIGADRRQILKTYWSRQWGDVQHIGADRRQILNT